MNNNKLFLDIHAIQSVPPSNINRDDTGSPKTAQYGGVTRARVSSQSWKKAIRDNFNKNVNEINPGYRTQKFIELISNKIVSMDSSKNDKSEEMAKKILKTIGIGIKKDEDTGEEKTDVLLFISEKQATKLAELALNNDYNAKELKEAFGSNPSIDLALFGRMVAKSQELNEDASCQVAHAISTHAVSTEFDFFTAVDDLAPEDNSGAGMLGTIEYNSSTLYRYANISIHELLYQLNNDINFTCDTVKLFIKEFVESMPTGKINSFANQTLPKTIVVTLRQDRPVNLVSAYENPVKSRGGYLEESTDRLFKELNKTEKFVKQPLFTYYVDLDNYKFENGIEANNLEELLNSVKEDLESEIREW